MGRSELKDSHVRDVIPTARYEDGNNSGLRSRSCTMVQSHCQLTFVVDPLFQVHMANGSAGRVRQLNYWVQHAVKVGIFGQAGQSVQAQTTLDSRRCTSTTLQYPCAQFPHSESKVTLANDL